MKYIKRKKIKRKENSREELKENKISGQIQSNLHIYFPNLHFFCYIKL